MKQGLYLKIFNKINNEKISALLANLIYFLVCIKYVLIKAFRKKQKSVLPSVSAAREKLMAISPKPLSDIVVENLPVKEGLDLSIIVPVYNYEKVIRRMIESILNQKTRYSYELILVDDGSNEETKSILWEYQERANVKLIFQKNMGISGARNTGLSVAEGKYIMFVDCDDTVHSDIVEKLLSRANGTNADIVMCGHRLIKERDGQIISVRNDIYPVYNLEGYKDGDYIMNYPGLPWGKVYKKYLFQNIRYPLNYWYEDTIIQFLVFRMAKSFEYIPEALYDYRWYEGNYSKVQSKSRSKVIDHYWVLEYIIKENQKLNLKNDKIFYKTLLRHLGSYLYNAVSVLDEQTQKEIFAMACNLTEQFKPDENYSLNYKLSELEKCFDKKDYYIWRIISTML